jgi:hypothetical protein
MRYRALIVLVVSGLAGFRLGWTAFPSWQVAVETAQVTAGVVQYPSATPFFLYHVKLWTILHQVLAVFLRLGVSEVRLSLWLSGLLGMISFQALSMFVFALSGDVILAVGAAMVLFVSRATDFGVVYPIALMGSMHTYGIIGLSLIVLVVGLIGSGCYRSGAFLLALTPAVHPSLGAWLLLLVGIAILFDVHGMREAAGPALGYFIAGALVTSASLAYQLASAFPEPPVDAAVTSRYLLAFTQLWDVHRQPVDLFADGVSLNRAAFALALISLVLLRDDVTRDALFLLRVVLVASAMSLLVVFLSWVPPEWVPGSLLVLMPNRLLNFNAMTFVALLFGLIGAYRHRPWSRVLIAMLAVLLVFGDRSMVWQWLVEGRIASHVPAWTRWIDFWTAIELTSLLLVLFALIERTTKQPAADQWLGTTEWTSGWKQMAAIAGRVAFVVLAAALLVLGWRRVADRYALFRTADNDTVFHEAAAARGLLITGGDLSLIQLRTRRPVLLNGGGLDGLPYSLSSGPETERILRDVYGIDFFNPPKEAYRTGVIPSRYNQQVWEQFTPDQWYAIRYTYQANQIVAPATWQLKLPVVAQDGDLRLYQIPDR